MEVIFLMDVKGVARKGEVKLVNDGYALNFLLPRALAEVATPNKVAALRHSLEQQTAERAAMSVAMQTTVSELAGRRVEIIAKANPKGGLFANISAEDIIRALAVNLTPEQVVITTPIKTLGEHPVEIRAGEDTTATITVDVKAK